MEPGLWMLVAGSTLSWSAFDAVRKQLVKRISVAALAFWISVAQLPGYLIWALMDGRFSVGPGYLWPALASVVLNLLANVLFLESVRRGALSVTIPVLSFTPVFVALGGLPLLGERLNPEQWFGVAIVALASLFLTARPDTMRRPTLLVAGFIRAPGVLHMLGVAVLWSISPLFDKLALRHAAVGVHGTVLALSGAIGMALYLIARRKARSLALPAGSLGLLALGGVTNVAALGLQLVVIGQMVVSVFEAIKRAAGVLIALGLGAIAFREVIKPTRAFAAVVMALGVVLVLSGSGS